MNVAKTRRLIKILSLLQNPSGFNAAEIAEACGVVKRTVFRDLKLLRQAGLPIEYDADADRHRLADGALLPGLNLSFSEALALLVLGQEAARADVTPLVGDARSAINKLTAALPAAIQDELRDAAPSVRVARRPVGRHDDAEDAYDAFVDAVARRSCVRISYHSFTEREVICTKVSPYVLAYCRHAWYVVGRSSLHREARTFHLGRIQKFEVLDEEFEAPKGFSLDRYLGNAWSMIPEPGADRDVVIRFAKKVARNVADVVWHKTQQTELQRDESLLFRVRVSGLNEISWWVLGYGDQAEVLEPEDLRRLVAKHVQNMAKRYAKPAKALGKRVTRVDPPETNHKAQGRSRTRRPLRKRTRGD